MNLFSFLLGALSVLFVELTALNAFLDPIRDLFQLLTTGLNIS
jgi:hypothetical protein